MTAKHAILVSYDSARELDKIFHRCRDSVERYADTIGADLLIKKSHSLIGCCISKYELVAEASRAGYERVLQLDADIYIHTTENIFDAVGDAVIAQRKTSLSQQGQPWFGGWTGDWTWNGGVIVAKPAILEAYLAFANLHRGKFWSDEAILIPFLEFAQIEVFPLPFHFNEWASPTNDVMQPAWRGFAHFSGDNKLDRWPWFESQYLQDSSVLTASSLSAQV